MSLNNTRHDLNCDYLHQDLHAFKEENTRLIEQLMALEEQFEVMEQRISELETEALISQQIESNDASMQKQFALLFDEAPAPMLLTNQHGDIEMLNQAACRMLNQSCDAALNQNFRKFLQKQSAYDLVLLLRDSEHSTEKVRGQKVFVLKNNDIFTLSLVRLNHPGRYGGYYLMSPMMVNLKEVSSQSLRLSNIIIDQIREGLMVTDAKGQIIRINQAFSEITGFSPADVEGKTPAILHSGRHSKRFYDDMWLEIQHHGWWCGEIWNRRKSGEVYPEWLQISRIHDQQTGQVFYVATFSDITDRKAYQGQLDRLAFYDALTGLPNRSLLNQFLETQLIHLQEKADRMLAVLFLDLDKFKDVNDHYGHAEGDYVLREATQRIMARLGESDMASRIGGDEFVMVLTRITAVEEAIDITRDLLNLLSDPFNTPKSAHRLSASIGIALAPLHGDNAEDLMRRADAAMYQAKQNGRNAYQVFDKKDENRITEVNHTLKLLWKAVEKPNNHIQMHYQPIFKGHNTQVPTHYEALIRLVDDQSQLVFPDLFIEVAEQNGVIAALGYALFEKVCHDIHQAQLPLDIKVAVNLSPIQLHQEAFIERLEAIAARFDMTLERFHFEVTETATIQNVNLISNILVEMKQRGAKIMLDDFGTGFASLSILKNLPVDILKIDRSFIQELPESIENQSMVNAMIAMAKALGLEVVTEGVETHPQYQWLLAQDVNLFQGYLLGKPEPHFIQH